MRCATVGDLRISIPALVGPKLCEHLEVFLKHLSERASQALLFLIVETRSDNERNKMMNVPVPDLLNTDIRHHHAAAFSGNGEIAWLPSIPAFLSRP